MVSQPSVYPSEIHDRVRRGYLERLKVRIDKMRKFLAERNWQGLKKECLHLKNTAATFDLESLTLLAGIVEREIPSNLVSNAVNLPSVRKAAENLFSEVDRIEI